MTIKKLTDEEIIKALECCSEPFNECAGCPLYDDYPSCEIHIIELINRQKAEIEKLKECPKCVYEYDGEMTEYCIQGPCPNFKTFEQIKSEAYKEFAERLKEKSFKTIRNYGLTKDVVEVCDIDNLLKEMVGEDNA